MLLFKELSRKFNIENIVKINTLKTTNTINNTCRRLHFLTETLLVYLPLDCHFNMARCKSFMQDMKDNLGKIQYFLSHL